MTFNFNKEIFSAAYKWITYSKEFAEEDPVALK